MNSADVVGLLALPTMKPDALTKLNATIVVKLKHLPLDLVKYGKNEKEVVTIRCKESLSFPEARKIVEARHNLSFSTVLKTNQASSIELKDVQTQTK